LIRQATAGCSFLLSSNLKGFTSGGVSVTINGANLQSTNDVTALCTAAQILPSGLDVDQGQGDIKLASQLITVLLNNAANGLFGVSLPSGTSVNLTCLLGAGQTKTISQIVNFACGRTAGLTPPDNPAGAFGTSSSTLLSDILTAINEAQAGSGANSCLTAPCR
jgi:hypothetical protein